MPGQSPDEGGVAQEQSGLWAAEEFVTAGDHQVGAGGQRRRGVGFVGEQRVGLQQATADVGDQRDVVRVGEFA